MRKWIICLICPVLLLLTSCDKGQQMDVVLFCKAFNRSSTTLQIREENVLKRSEQELIVPLDKVLMRLQTNEENAIHSVVLTASEKDIEQFCSVSQTAFSVLAEPFEETVPDKVLKAISSPTETVETFETAWFRYLVYKAEGTVTVEQINLLLFSLPVQPTLLLPESR